MQQTEDARVSRTLLIALLLIIALGASLRIYRLGAESFWLDEAYSVEIASLPTAAVIHELIINDVHPPLYYFAVHFWIKLFGASEWSVRFISVLFGILAIPLIFLLAARLFDPVTGLLAAALLALSHFHIGFSQEARMYALLVSLTLLSMYFFFKMLEGKSHWTLVGYVASSTLMMHTQVYSFFIIAAQNLYFLTLAFTAKEIFLGNVKRWLLAELGLALLFVPWFFALMQQLSRVQRGFWIPDEPPRAILDTLYLHAGSIDLAWILFPLIAFAALSAWISLGKEEGGVAASLSVHRDNLISGRLKIYLLLLWLVCPIVLPFLVSKFSSPIFLPKYTIPALPAFIILAAHGLSCLRFHQLRMLIVALILCFSLINLRNYYGTVKKDQWRDAVARLEEKADANDAILFNPPSSVSAFDYYSRRTDLIKIPFPDYMWDFKAETVAQYLKPVVEGRSRIWLVLSQQNQLSPLIARHLGEWYDLKAHGIYSGVETFLFEKRK